MAESDTLGPVRSLSATKTRTVTPSKIVVRHSTPQRPISNPRSGSASKTRTTFDIQTVPHIDNNIRAPSRSASRRKQRRWENQNIFNHGINDVLAQELDEEEENDFRRKGRRMQFKVEWRSAFQELFEAKNAEALDAFRMCAEKCDKYSSNRRRYCSAAELSWINVEKKLRQIVVKAIVKNVDIMNFIVDLEKLLVAYYIEGNELNVREYIGEALRTTLQRLPHVDDNGDLSVQFVDSAFHRLLLHAICQFYGFKSSVSSVFILIALSLSH